MSNPCHAKIVATRGPASTDRVTIEALVHAGADVFRLNFSHGTRVDHKARLERIHEVESDLGRPIGLPRVAAQGLRHLGCIRASASNSTGAAPCQHPGHDAKHQHGTPPGTGMGARIVLSPDVPGMDRMTRLVIDTAERLGYARVMAAGMPFGTSGTAHLLRIAQVD